jgi:hypothetical protein
MDPHSSHHPRPPDEGHHLVTIEVNHLPLKIKPGTYTVAEIKKEAVIPAADELSSIIDGQLRPLSNDERLHIHGGECFLSNAPVGKSS